MECFNNRMGYLMANFIKCADCGLENPTVLNCIQRFKSGEVGCNSDNLISILVDRIDGIDELLVSLIQRILALEV